MNISKKILFFLVLYFLFANCSIAQQPDTVIKKVFTQPYLLEQPDTSYKADSVIQRLQNIQDSLRARLQYIQDSIAAREKFIRDSIIAREKFVRDSIRRRERILDSLNFLKVELPRLFDASFKAMYDEIVIFSQPVQIIGDSTLTDYKQINLPFQFNQPYVPWKTSINLSTHPVKLTIDTINKKILGLQGKKLSCRYSYNRREPILIIFETSSIVTRRSGNFYKEPVDSVFFDRFGRVSKVKKYFQLYRLTANYQRGAKLFAHLNQVKQFEYNSRNQLVKYEIVNFCDRWKAGEALKVCNKILYTLTIQGKRFVLNRKNDPVNKYSDGVYIYDFDYQNNLKSVAFTNDAKTEDWKYFIEMNDLGNVSNYFYQKNGKVYSSLMIVYNLDNPNAKHKIEKISCTFEDDGISYFQKNTTTGKSRTRDKLTMEWSSWK